jgi:hypothetical protein
MLRVILDYEKLPVSKQGLQDEREYWYRMAMQNLTVRFSPWALKNHYSKTVNGDVYKSSPFLMSLSKAVQNNRSYGNDRPYTIAEAEKLYGGGTGGTLPWVKFENHWTKTASFGQVWKSVSPVIGGIVTGALAGGPVGAVVGGIGGAAKYIAAGKAAQKTAIITGQTKASQAVLTNAEQQLAESMTTAQASADLLKFDGPKLWPLGILIIMVLVLFFKKGGAK